MIATKGSDVGWQWLRLCWVGRVSGDPVSRCAVVGGMDGNFDWNSQHGLQVVVASGMLLNAAVSGGCSVCNPSPGESSLVQRLSVVRLNCNEIRCWSTTVITCHRSCNFAFWLSQPSNAHRSLPAVSMLCAVCNPICMPSGGI
jgi:hypothetical protein